VETTKQLFDPIVADLLAKGNRYKAVYAINGGAHRRAEREGQRTSRHLPRPTPCGVFNTKKRQAPSLRSCDNEAFANAEEATAEQQNGQRDRGSGDEAQRQEIEETGSLEPVPTVARVQAGVMKVMALVWVPGVAFALSSIGFGAITAFSALLFVTRGWAAWRAFTAFATAFIVTRLFLGHVADRFGGAKVALICATIEAVGLALIWLSPWSALALAGAALTGIGYSLVYPGFGVEAVRKVPAQSRGLAMGAYTDLLDVALAFGTPALGLVADVGGLSAAFAASMMAALGAAGIAAALLFTPRTRARDALACS
jgi:hypothetical protein